MKGRKREIKIKKNEFIDWFYSERDDKLSLADQIIKDLKTYEIFNTTISLDSIFARCGYIPERFIINKERLKDLIIDEEIEEPGTRLKPIWVEE